MSEGIEAKKKRQIQVVVIAAMSLFFVLVTVAVFTTAWLTYLRAEERALAKHNTELREQIRLSKDELEYIQSEQFIYDQAMRYHNRGRPGDIIYL